MCLITILLFSVRGTRGGGIITMSTNSTADVSRILNHRRMSAAPPPLHTPPPPTTTTNSIVTSSNTCYMASPSQLHRLAFHHHMASLDSKLHPSAPRTFSSRSSTIDVPTRGQFRHAQMSMVKSLPPTTIFGLRKQRRVEESSSSSDSDEDDDEAVHVSARQLQKIKSDKRASGGDFESVASWVRHKKDSLGRESDRFGRVNSFPNISNQNRSQNISQKSTNRLPDEPATSVSMSVRRCGINSKFAQSRHLLRRSSSLGSGLDEDHVYVDLIASGGKGKEDVPGAHESLVFNDMYEQRDSGSWQSPTSVANGSGDSEQQATDPSMHHYESVREIGLKRQPMSIESNPDYDYVKGVLST